jgi:hypothetical protein
MNELFAIEPTSFEDYKDIKLLLGQFGFHHGRFVAEYPKKWVRLVHEHLATLPDMERKRAVTVFESYRKDRTIRRGWPYVTEKSWIENAKEIKERRLIADFIVARNDDSEFATPDLDEEDYFKSWGGRQARVLSNPENYASAASMLLQESYEVAIVDPYISSLGNRFQLVLKQMAMVAMAGKCRKFYVFTLDDRSTLEQVERGARQFFGPICDAGIAVTYTVLRDMGRVEADDHPRFLVSMMGAMQFDRGFDAESFPRLRLVSVLDPYESEKLVRQYLEGAIPFEQVTSVELDARQ